MIDLSVRGLGSIFLFIDFQLQYLNDIEYLCKDIDFFQKKDFS